MRREESRGTVTQLKAPMATSVAFFSTFKLTSAPKKSLSIVITFRNMVRENFLLTLTLCLYPGYKHADRIDNASFEPTRKKDHIFQLTFPNAQLQSRGQSITLAHPEPKGAAKMNKLLKNRSKCCQTLLERKHLGGKRHNFVYVRPIWWSRVLSPSQDDLFGKHPFYPLPSTLKFSVFMISVKSCLMWREPEIIVLLPFFVISLRWCSKPQ